MSVLVEGISVIVRTSTLEAKYPGGVSAYRERCPNRTYCQDDHLTRVGFMNPTEVEAFIDTLRQEGLTPIENGHSVDVAVVDQLTGLTGQCDWLEGRRHPDGYIAAWLAGTIPGGLATPDSWTPSQSKEMTRVATSAPSERMLPLQEDGNVESFLDDTTGTEKYAGWVSPEPESHPDPVVLLKRALQGEPGAIERLLQRAELGEASAAAAAGRYFDVPDRAPTAHDPVRARALYRVAAVGGNAMGQLAYANMCDYGEGGPQDYAEARRWYGEAALQGVVDAQMHYAVMLERGRGGPKDVVEAAEWYARAVDRGDELAATNLALLHLTGALPSVDIALVVELLKFSALRLDHLAHRYLGALYLQGQGVARDLSQAAFHLSVVCALAPEDQAREAEALLRQVVQLEPGLQDMAAIEAQTFIQEQLGKQTRVH